MGTREILTETAKSPGLDARRKLVGPHRYHGTLGKPHVQQIEVRNHISTQEQNIGRVCVQVHTGRAPALSVSRLTQECEVIARRTEGVRGIDITEGEDNGSYLNIVFATEKPIASWRGIRLALLESTEFGSDLKASCIFMCTGEDGWNDYLLL